MTSSACKTCQDILDNIIMDEESSKAKYNRHSKVQQKVISAGPVLYIYTEIGREVQYQGIITFRMF